MSTELASIRSSADPMQKQLEVLRSELEGKQAKILAMQDREAAEEAINAKLKSEIFEKQYFIDRLTGQAQEQAGPADVAEQLQEVEHFKQQNEDLKKQLQN